MKFLSVNRTLKKSVVYKNKDHKLMAVLLQNPDTDEVIILNKSSLKIIRRINVPKVEWPKNQISNTLPIFLDDEKLVVISKAGKNQTVNFFQIDSGENVFHKELGRHDHNIHLTENARFLTFESLSAHERIFTAIDLKHNKTSALVNLGKLDVKTHIFKDALYFSQLRSPRSRSYFTLNSLNLSNNKRSEYPVQSTTHFTFVNNHDHTQLFIAGKNTKKKKNLYLMSFRTIHDFDKQHYHKKINPLSLATNEKNHLLMVIGTNKLAIIDTTKNQMKSVINIPFDPLWGFINHDGNTAYIQENNGSEVANFDLINGQFIQQSNAGRIMAQSVVNLRKYALVGFAGIAGGITEMLFSRLVSQKNMILDNQQKHLFVINNTTNDLSVFDAQTLKKKYSRGTGKGTNFISQGPKENSPILIVGKKFVSVVDHQLERPAIRFKKAKVVGLDWHNDILFMVMNKNLHIYDMLHDKKLAVVKQPETLAVYSY